MYTQYSLIIFDTSYLFDLYSTPNIHIRPQIITSILVFRSQTSTGFAQFSLLMSIPHLTSLC